VADYIRLQKWFSNYNKALSELQAFVEPLVLNKPLIKPSPRSSLP